MRLISKKAKIGFLFFIYLISNDTLSEEARSINKINFKNISTSIPKELFEIIQELQKPLSQRKIAQNFLLLYGPKGNGKRSTIAEISLLLNAELVTINIPAIVRNCDGIGLRILEENLKDILEKARDNNRSLIVYFSNADAVINNVSNDLDVIFLNEVKKRIFEWVDTIKLNKNIFIVANSNSKIRELDPSFAKYYKKIEIKNPDLEKRKEIINFQFNRLGLKRNNAFINALSIKMDKLNNEHIIEIISNVYSEVKKSNKEIFLDTFDKPIRTYLLTKFEFKDISGSIPEEFGILIFKLKYPIPGQKLSQNTLLIQGPTGSGKTTLVKEIVEYLDADLINLQTQTIVDNYQGSGAKTINEFFDSIINKSKNNPNQLIFGFCDEADILIRPDNITKDSKEWIAAKQLFWQWMDRVKQYRNVSIILSTNVNTKKLDARIIGRCHEIVLNNPDDVKRKEVIEFHFDKLGVKKDELDMAKLVKETKELNLRAITEIVEEVVDNSRYFYGNKITQQMFDEPIRKQKAKPQKIEEPEVDYVFSDKVQRYSTYINTGLNILKTGLDTYNFFYDGKKVLNGNFDGQSKNPGVKNSDNQLNNIISNQIKKQNSDVKTDELNKAAAAA